MPPASKKKKYIYIEYFVRVFYMILFVSLLKVWLQMNFAAAVSTQHLCKLALGSSVWHLPIKGRAQRTVISEVVLYGIS